MGQCLRMRYPVDIEGEKHSLDGFDLALKHGPDPAVVAFSK